MLLYLLIPLSLATCSPLSAPAPVAPESIIVVGNMTVTHTPTTSFTPLCQPIKPTTAEITWLKSQVDKTLPTKLAKPIKTVIQTELVAALEQQRTRHFVVAAENFDDSFSLRIQVLKGNKTTCTLQTLHPTCPPWIEMVVKQSLEQVTADAKSKQRKILAGCIIGAVGISAIAHKNHLDTERARRAEDAIKAEDARRRAEQVTAFRPKFKHWLTTTPFLRFLDGDNKQAPDAASSLESMDRYCRSYFDDILSEDFNLNTAQRLEFLRGSFKEETINLLARFEEDYKRANVIDRQQGMHQTTEKERSLDTFLKELINLQKNDPVEAKRILCFHPALIYQSIAHEGFDGKQYINPPFIATSQEPPDVYKGPQLPSFRSVLIAYSLRPDLLSHGFPSTFEMFQGLHLVNANPS